MESSLSREIFLMIYRIVPKISNWMNVIIIEKNVKKISNLKD